MSEHENEKNDTTKADDTEASAPEEQARPDRPERREIPLERKLEIALETAADGMRLLGISVESLRGEVDGEQVVVRVGNIVEPEGASLEGRVWESLQFLFNKAINREAARRTRLRLETESFRGRRGEKLGKVAQTLASKVVTLRRPITIGPMAPAELRQLSSQLSRAGGVAVQPDGGEAARKLVISPGQGGRRRRRRR